MSVDGFPRFTYGNFDTLARYAPASFNGALQRRLAEGDSAVKALLDRINQETAAHRRDVTYLLSRCTSPDQPRIKRLALFGINNAGAVITDHTVVFEEFTLEGAKAQSVLLDAGSSGQADVTIEDPDEVAAFGRLCAAYEGEQRRNNHQYN